MDFFLSTRTRRRFGEKATPFASTMMFKRKKTVAADSEHKRKRQKVSTIDVLGRGKQLLFAGVIWLIVERFDPPPSQPRPFRKLIFAHWLSTPFLRRI